MIFSILCYQTSLWRKKSWEEVIFKIKCWREFCWWCQFSNKYNFIMMAALVVWSGLTLLGKYTRFIKSASSKKCPKFDGSLPYYIVVKIIIIGKWSMHMIIIRRDFYTAARVTSTEKYHLVVGKTYFCWIINWKLRAS